MSRENRSFRQDINVRANISSDKKKTPVYLKCLNKILKIRIVTMTGKDRRKRRIKVVGF